MSVFDQIVKSKSFIPGVGKYKPEKLTVSRFMKKALK